MLHVMLSIWGSTDLYGHDHFPITYDITGSCMMSLGTLYIRIAYKRSSIVYTCQWNRRHSTGTVYVYKLYVQNCS